MLKLNPNPNPDPNSNPNPNPKPNPQPNPDAATTPIGRTTRSGRPRVTSRSGRRLATGLPVVARELIQMSSRRRTYLLRVAYAVALFALATCFYWDEVRLSGNNSTWDLLGTGDRLLENLASMQILGIWLFLPAMVAPALTVEKERQTLPLLFLTRLGPTMLLVEKLVSRLIPMFSLILLSLPLLMIAWLSL